MTDFNPEKLYEDLKNEIGEVKMLINKLNMTKNLLSIFHVNKYQEEIKQISINIRNIQENSLNNYRELEKSKYISNLKKYESIAEQVKIVKDFILFKVIYEEESESDQEKRFNEALKKLKEIKASFDNKHNVSEIYKKIKLFLIK